MNRTAMQETIRTDRRRLRTMAFEQEIMHIVGKHISDEDRAHDCMRAISRELFEKLHAEGAEIITDETRSEMGLPPRGPDGWTTDELIALETRRLEMMKAPMPPTLISKESVKI